MVDPAEFLDIARTADEWGWDSIQVADAPFFPEVTVAHYHDERNHQGKDNLLLFSSLEPSPSPRGDAIECKQRLGGMLKYYYREAA